MDTLPLPSRPNLEQYRKRAKGLVNAARSSDPGAVETWASEWLDSLVGALGVEVTPFVQASMERAVTRIDGQVRAEKSNRFGLADAQHLIAAAHGFENWPSFARHVLLLSGGQASHPFEKAADAVVTGDLAALESLLRRDPGLVHARSSRVHHATLLHYVAANGVEDFRQKTPANVVAIARLLLERGADVDALADTYDSDWWQTTLNLLVSSTHPASAGVQSELVEVLADFGAALNGLRDDETPLFTALDFGYAAAAETLARRGARIDNIITAAALGRMDLVRAFVVDANTLQPHVPMLAPPWWKLPNDPTRHLERAFVWACKFARAEVADFFLDIGVDPAAADSHEMTALHWAAGNGCTRLVERLIERGARLEARNAWQGTVLDSTAHFAIHMPVEGVDYRAIIEMLIAAGADARAAYPSGSDWIDDILRRRGAAEERPQ